MPNFLPIAERVVMPWKNGGGSTTEIMVWPEGADFASFDWRVSVAKIASAGPFSMFAGIDRTLSLLQGAGVDLQMQDEGERQDIALRANLEKGQQTVQFRGEAQVIARLVDGASTDFNVMTRRSSVTHQFQRLELAGEMQWQNTASASLLFVAELDKDAHVLCSTTFGAHEFRLQHHDSLLFDSNDAKEWRIASSSNQPATIFIVQIHPLAQSINS